MSRRRIYSISALSIFSLAFIGGILVFGIFRVAEEIQPAPQYYQTDTAVPNVSAKAWQVFDLETGTVLYAHEPDLVLPIASITKLFTASTFFKHAELAATSTITWGDVLTEGRAGKLGAGETYTNRELVFPLLLESSNDAATAMARAQLDIIYDIKSDLAELELEHTVIADTSGLSEQNVSTVAELARVTRYLYAHEPRVFDITQLSAYYTDNNGWINNSPFILDDSYRGGKHGFTYAANRTGVALFAEELSGNAERLLGYVILGSDDLAADMASLRTFVQENVSFR